MTPAPRYIIRAAHIDEGEIGRPMRVHYSTIATAHTLAWAFHLAEILDEPVGDGTDVWDRVSGCRAHLPAPIHNDELPF